MDSESNTIRQYFQESITYKVSPIFNNLFNQRFREDCRPIGCCFCRSLTISNQLTNTPLNHTLDVPSLRLQEIPPFVKRPQFTTSLWFDQPTLSPKASTPRLPTGNALDCANNDPACYGNCIGIDSDTHSHTRTHTSPSQTLRWIHVVCAWKKSSSVTHGACNAYTPGCTAPLRTVTHTFRVVWVCESARSDFVCNSSAFPQKPGMSWCQTNSWRDFFRRKEVEQFDDWLQATYRIRPIGFGESSATCSLLKRIQKQKEPQ